MSKLDDVLKMWADDSNIDRTEPGKALIDIPKLHSKYLNILSQHRLLVKDAEFKYNRMKKLKWEYYTGKLDEDELQKLGWEPFRFVLKSDISVYIDGDDDLNKLKRKKSYHEETAKYCENVMKELNARTYQLRAFMDWEKFIQGAR